MTLSEQRLTVGEEQNHSLDQRFLLLALLAAGFILLYSTTDGFTHPPGSPDGGRSGVCPIWGDEHVYHTTRLPGKKIGVCACGSINWTPEK